MIFKKIIFQNRYVALETPSRPPPFMAKASLNFYLDYLTPSLTGRHENDVSIGWVGWVGGLILSFLLS